MPSAFVSLSPLTGSALRDGVETKERRDSPDDSKFVALVIVVDVRCLAIFLDICVSYAVC